MHDRRERRNVDIGDVAANVADEMMVLAQRGFVARRHAVVREDLDKPDLTQDVDRPINGAQADAREMAADALEQGLGRQMRTVVEGIENRRPLLGQAISASQQARVHAVGAHD